LVPAKRFFFIHIMKTGGTSFRTLVKANFKPVEVFPDPGQEPDAASAYIHVSELESLSEERHAQIRVYSGHFPFYATNCVPGPVVTLTILREPIARTISYLKHCKRYHERHAALALEEIYEDPWITATNIRNYQAKLFSLVRNEGFGTALDEANVDDGRLRRAQANLETVDIVGILEDFEYFIEQASTHLGLRGGNVPRLRASTEDWDVPQSFRRRIAEDNAAEMAFYEFARDLVAGRKAGRKSRP
jgi:Sulfotransferase family